MPTHMSVASPTPLLAVIHHFVVVLLVQPRDSGGTARSDNPNLAKAKIIVCGFLKDDGSIAEEAVIKLGVFTQVDIARELEKVALVVVELEMELNQIIIAIALPLLEE
eukprot:scaffold4541_cov121-Skeletonema_marinoi.AAC.4